MALVASTDAPEYGSWPRRQYPRIGSGSEPFQAFENDEFGDQQPKQNTTEDEEPACAAGAGHAADVDAEQARAASLAGQQSSVAAQTASVGAQIDALRDELTRLRIQIANQQAELRSAGVAIPASLNTQINATINASPSGANDAERLANLQRAIADARALSAELARLSA